jgi:hypothetical protein
MICPFLMRGSFSGRNLTCRRTVPLGSQHVNREAAKRGVETLGDAQKPQTKPCDPVATSRLAGFWDPAPD